MQTRIPSIFSMVVIAWCCLTFAFDKSLSADETLRYDRDIRPILSENCFPCHGPNEESRRGGFRLDVRNSAIAEADSGNRPIVPSNATDSDLIRRIESVDSSEQMPPKPHKPLTAAEKKSLARWIAEGAKYERHWSFDVPQRPDVPEVNKKSWPKNPIDHFVLAALERKQLLPSPEVNRETLIRRVSLDLTGLPATPKEIDAFLLSDSNDRTYERLVDRLMARSSYAERRAQDWLDLARYADTRGFADDKMRDIWPYRDWVIRAFDRNMPFDRFTVEQLAGDMLPEATDEQRLASAFHRNAPQAKGQTYPVEEYRVKGVVDRVNTTSRVWLGLTLDCAQCHDHKFDPISQRDYYAMFAIFNNIHHGGLGFAQGGPTMKYKPIPFVNVSRQIDKRARLESALKIAHEKLPSPKLIEDKSLIGKWNGNATVENATKSDVTNDLTITARIQTTQAVADIVSKYDWRGKQRSYVFGIGAEGDKNGTAGHLFFWASSQTDPFSGVEIYGSQKVNDGNKHYVAVVLEAGKSVRLFVDGVEDSGAIVIGNVPKSIAKSNRSLSIGSGYNDSVVPNAYHFTGGLGDVRLFGKALGEKIDLGKVGADVASLQAAIRELDGKRDPEAAELPTVPVMRELVQPRDSRIHIRGNFLNPGEKVSPAVPSLFGVEKRRNPRNRLEFARWLVDGKNPLVARVVVNRFWQSYFGNGLVRTPDDFGTQGSSPTHPKLLDWLADEFVASGWDMKHIHKLIVTSATYRQSTYVSPELVQRDPQNRLLARMSRVRLPAEQIRDQALFASGLLDQKIGGPSVFPKQPENYWKQRALPGSWLESKQSDRYRKTMYTYWRRMALHPSLELLDAPARESCVVRREVSNVPTQALVLLNDPIFTDAAAALGKRITIENEDDALRLHRVFRLVLGRRPKSIEQIKFLDYISRQRNDLETDPSATAMIIGSKHLANNVDLAVWILVCSVVLNLDEAITRP